MIEEKYVSISLELCFSLTPSLFLCRSVCASLSLFFQSYFLSLPSFLAFSLKFSVTHEDVKGILRENDLFIH